MVVIAPVSVGEPVCRRARIFLNRELYKEKNGFDRMIHPFIALTEKRKKTYIDLCWARIQWARVGGTRSGPIIIFTIMQSNENARESANGSLAVSRSLKHTRVFTAAIHSIVTTLNVPTSERRNSFYAFYKTILKCTMRLCNNITCTSRRLLYFCCFKQIKTFITTNRKYFLCNYKFSTNFVTDDYVRRLNFFFSIIRYLLL